MKEKEKNNLSCRMDSLESPQSAWQRGSLPLPILSQAGAAIAIAMKRQVC